MSGNPTRADLWHIKVGNTSWCNCALGNGFMRALIEDGKELGYLPTCSHRNKAQAENMAHFLNHELRINARVVPGGCDQNEDYRSDDDE